MKTNKISLLTVLALLALSACNSDETLADGYGNFEATEILVSSEASGRLLELALEEGSELAADSIVGWVDTVPLHLKKAQLFAAKDVIRAKSAGVLSQIEVIEARKANLIREKERVEQLLKDEAATPKQLDDIEGELKVLDRQMASIERQNAPVVSELRSIDAQLTELNDRISRSKIKNPINGTVLAQYAHESEVTAMGKPLYKIADLDKMELRVYVSETQLSSLKLGQQVTVKIDEKEGLRDLQGEVAWVSSKAEFTPKVIQTREERVNLVYAVKVHVPNDGSLKIGMPGEMWLR